jgi:hypothetical protein
MLLGANSPKKVRINLAKMGGFCWSLAVTLQGFTVSQLSTAGHKSLNDQASDRESPARQQSSFRKEAYNTRQL